MENTKLRTVTILDTTLRDGEQAPQNGMPPSQRLALALKLEDIGINTIEIGFPASSKNDYESVKLISEKLTKASYATFSRTKKADIDIALKAGGICDRHLIMLVATASDIHLNNKRSISREEGLQEIRESVMYTKNKGVTNIAVGLEDASRASSDYIIQIVEESIQAGANQIILADTTGYAVPEEFGKLVSLVKEVIGERAKLAIHCHNDMGLATANSLQGIINGADEVQVTIGGIGERAGNTSLEQIAAILYYKGDDYGLHIDINLNKLYEAFLMLQKYINLEDSRMQPIVGKYVFSTSAGIHQQGLINNPSTYEYVKAVDFGRKRDYIIDLHSGRSILGHILSDLGISIEEDQLDVMYKKYIIDNPAGAYYTVEQLKEKIILESTKKGKE